MEQTAFRTRKHSRWTHRMAFERKFGVPRGTLLSNASDTDSILRCVLGAGHLDTAMFNQLAHLLTVTARDWARRLPD